MADDEGAVGAGQEVLQLRETKTKDTFGLKDVDEISPADLSPVFSPLADELSESLRAACGLPSAEVTVSPSDCALPESYCHYAQRIRRLEVRSDDIWIVSFPKSGSHIMQEMAWLLTQNVDCEKATNTPLHQRFTFLEYVTLWPEGSEQPDTVCCVEDTPSPRYIKSHLPLELLPTQLWTQRPKIIYVGRNPKDTAVDYLAHYKDFYKYSGSKELFFEAFYRDRVVYSPFWEHVLAFWERRKEGNVLITTFEEMSQSLPAVLKRTATFLGVVLDKASEDRLLQHLGHQGVRKPSAGDEEGSGDCMTPRPLGQAGNWRSSMTRSCVEKFDRWTKEKLAGTDFSNVFMII